MGVLRDPRGDRLPERDLPGADVWIVGLVLMVILVALLFTALSWGSGRVSDSVDYEWEPTTGLSAPAHPGG